jgi:hypothetical protein
MLLLLALLVVILVAISMLYCLGFASLAFRQAQQGTLLPQVATYLPPDGADVTPTPFLGEATPQPASVP